jgi:hypothetical protein
MRLQELFGFVKAPAQEFTDLSLRQFTRPIAFQGKYLQGTPTRIRPVKV